MHFVDTTINSTPYILTACLPINYEDSWYISKWVSFTQWMDYTMIFQIAGLIYLHTIILREEGADNTGVGYRDTRATGTTCAGVYVAGLC